MSYCFEQGIPHSKFLEWEPEDRAKAIAFQLESQLRCDMCGTAQWEWEENPFAYEPVDEFCKGCYLKNVFQSQEGTELAGTNVKLIPVTPLRKAQRVVQARKRAKMMRESRKKKEE